MYANGFQLAPGEEFIQCPYHKAHLITNAKFSMHLQKCRNAYIKEKGTLADFKVCRFNFNHRYPNLEIKSHEKTCPDQYNLIRSVAVSVPLDNESNDKGQPERKRFKLNTDDDNQVQDVSGTGHEEEDWESECNPSLKPAYDPTEKLRTQVIHYIEPGLTKAERRDRRLENRKNAQFGSNTGSNIKIEEVEQRNTPTTSEPSPTVIKGGNSSSTVDPRESKSSSSSSKHDVKEPDPPKTSYHKPNLDWDDDD